MKHPSYTIEQAEFVQYVKHKVQTLFLELPSTAIDGFDHVSRVAGWALDIAMTEAPEHVFISELAAWLHAIGTVAEYQYDSEKKNQCERSYELLKVWMKQDIQFYALKEYQKLELLYAVRYQSNDYADKYTSASILRDAKKMDVFGDQGLQRILARCTNTNENIIQNLRLVYDALYHLRSTYANDKVIQESLMKPIDEYYASLLRAQIEVVTVN